MSDRLHPQAAMVVERLTSGPAPKGAATVELVRQYGPAPDDLKGPPESMAAVVDLVAELEDGPCALRVYRPPLPPGTKPGVAVYLHGGGWVIGGLDVQDGLCRALAKAGECVIVSVDYRLAPEHPYPAALRDAWSATRWVTGAGEVLNADVGRLAVIGDSAGGNLAAGVALRARDAGSPDLALQVLICPVTAYEFVSPSMEEFADGCFLTRSSLQWYWAHYLADPADADDPGVSPLRALDLRGVAEALVVTAECDPLRDQAEAYAAWLLAAGVPVTSVRYLGMMHAFMSMQGSIDAARDALALVGRQLRAAVGARAMEDGGTQ